MSKSKLGKKTQTNETFVSRKSLLKLYLPVSGPSGSGKTYSLVNNGDMINSNSILKGIDVVFSMNKEEKI